MIRANVLGHAVRFETAPGLFSPAALDAGTLAMLGQARFDEDDKVLDLGCGYGLVGVTAALEIGADRVWMLDVDPAAVACAKRNLALNGVAGAHVVQSDGFRGLTETGFTKILCNPPYHADFSVAKHLIEKGFNRLVVGGSMWMVTKRDAWYRNKLTAIFGGVRGNAVDGYVVFEAVKTSGNYANKGGR
jgi:16S rRNA (guanine1207-N2)-methyltransferase